MHDELLGSPLHGFNPPHGPIDSTSGTRYTQPVVNDGKGEVMQDLGNSVCYHDVNYLPPLAFFPSLSAGARQGMAGGDDRQWGFDVVGFIAMSSVFVLILTLFPGEYACIRSPW